jgi:two-component system OmpR family response regulator
VSPEARTAAHRILVVEDDPQMGGLLASGLRRAGFVVDTMTDGADVTRQVSRQEYSAIVLDVLLPGTSGFEVCAALRQRGRWVPVLMLTALGATGDRVRGLQVGADDYLTKPFEFAELTARVQALIRLRDASEAQSLRWGNLRLEVAAQRCFVGETQVHLTPREVALLRVLLRRPGIVLTRRTLLNQAWGGNRATSPNAVDQAIANLRRKIGQDYLETVHGVGYRMIDPPPTG